MGKQFDTLSGKQVEFIKQQKLFFVGTATDTSRVNISPKGMDSLRVLDSNNILWLNVTGSGNESAAHIQTHPRMTLMFMAFEGKPLILRLYGKAEVIHPKDSVWAEYIKLFKPLPGARQVFRLSVEMVQSSCGMSVPFFDYAGDREQLNDWATKKGEQGIVDYWEEKNQFSIDGIATNIL